MWLKLLSWRDFNCLLKWLHYHNINVYVYSMNTLWDCWSQWILDLWLLVQQIKWIMCKKRNAHLMHNKYASHRVASALLSFSSFTKKQNRSRNLRNVNFCGILSRYKHRIMDHNSVVTVSKFLYSLPIPVKIHGSRYQFLYQSKTQNHAN